MLRKIMLIFLALSLLWPQDLHAEPATLAKAVVLMDLHTGQVLNSRNGDEKLPMASTTKILTVAVAMEKISLSEVAVASENASKQTGTSIYVKPGEKLSIKDLYYATLLKSANDAAVVVAEHVAGSVEQFASLMNQKAQAIGAKDSNFVNPNGLPDDRHYTTAKDLALIARYAMQKPLFRQIVGTETWDIPRDDPLAVKRLHNGNRMLATPGYKYEGTTGIKTGYTKKAQNCLVVSAKRGSQELVAVILGAQKNTVYNDAKILLDYGFEHFDTINAVKEGQALKVVSVNGSNKKVVLVAGESLYQTVEKGLSPEITKRITIDKDIDAPIKKGQKLGQVSYFSNGTKIGTVPLLSQSSVSQGIVHRMWWLWMPILGLVAGFVLYRATIKKRTAKLRSVV